MAYQFPNRSLLEKFGKKIYFLLVENFPETYYTGGTVRDFLLGRKTRDIDIATSAKPLQLQQLLLRNNVTISMEHEKFGVVVATQGSLFCQITTFRKETYGKNRYPTVLFTRTAKADSNRRDFTVNALYLALNSGQLLDFHRGLRDLKTKKIRFIGRPVQRIEQDPLRLLRAHRFARELGFSFTRETERAINQYGERIRMLTTTRLNKEIAKAKNKKIKQKLLSLVVHK